MGLPVRAFMAGTVLFGAASVALAAPASANTNPPTVSVCVQSFAASGLAAIHQFQASNHSPEATANLVNELQGAQIAFDICLTEALGIE